VIALSCFIKIAAIGSFGLSVVTIHASDRQTDGRTDRQNYDSQDRARIAASHGNNAPHLTTEFLNKDLTKSRCISRALMKFRKYDTVFTVGVIGRQRIACTVENINGVESLELIAF